jgi:hypothetical protein
LTQAETQPRLGHDQRFTAVLFVVALLPRLYVAIAWPREPVWDGHYYDFGARRIAAGLGYSDGVMGSWHPWCHWPVGFSGALSAMYWLFGATPRVATIFNALVGALLAVGTHRMARYGLGHWRARLAGLLVALFPGLIIYAALVMSEPLSALTLIIAGWAWLRFRTLQPRRAAGLCGFVLGLGTLVHPTFLAYAPALLFAEWALLNRRSHSPPSPESLPPLSSVSPPSPRWHALREASVRALIATACAFVPVLPWTARNCRVMDRCTLVSTNGGWNLAIGAFERATGRFETLRASDGCRVVTGQVQQDACWRQLAWQAIRRDPVRWLSLMPKKLAYTFDHESFPIEYLHEADPDRWPEARRERGREWLTTLHRVLLSAAALAVVRWPQRRDQREPRRLLRLADSARAVLVLSLVSLSWMLDTHPFWLLPVATTLLLVLPDSGRRELTPLFCWVALCLVGTIVTHAVFFGEDRYHVVVTPLVCLLAAAALRAHAESTSPAPHHASDSSSGASLR